MLLNALAIGLAVLVAAAGLLLAAGQAGLFRGKPPTLLGVQGGRLPPPHVTLALIHLSEPTRQRRSHYAVFCLKKKTHVLLRTVIAKLKA